MPAPSTFYTPTRCDLVWINFDPQAGHEQAGRRPALVLSSRSYNEASGLMLCCPITRQRKSYPFEVPLPSGWAVNGVVLSDHVKSIDWRVRQAEYIGTVPLVFFDEICLNINALLAG